MTTLAKNQKASPDPSSVDALDTPTLRAELANALGLTARHLLYLAAVWTELEKRGEDLSDLRTGIAVWLPAIAIGAVLPETVIAFAGQRGTLRAVATLPPAEQKRLIDGGSVPVTVREGDQYTHRLLPVRALPSKLIRQVFAERHIRTEGEQIAWLTPAVSKPGKTPKPPRRGALRADVEKRVVMLGKRQLNPADLIAALADLASPETPDDVDAEDSTVLVKLSATEHRSLKQKSLDGDTSQQQLIRNALRAMGLI